MRWSGFWAVMFVAATLAGCLQGDDDGEEELPSLFADDWSELALPFGGEHDHADRTHHANLSTANFEVIGHDPLISGSFGYTPAGYLCGDTTETEDGRRLAVVESRSEVGFAIADVTDASQPKWLGELVMPTTYVYDLAAVPDGKHAVLVTSQPIAPALPPVRLDESGRLVHTGIEWRTPCAPGVIHPVWATEDPVPRPVSILLIDISDPATPTIVDQRPIPGLGHSVFSTRIDDRIWILASMVGNPNVQVFQFFELIDTPAGGKLNLLSQHETEPHDPPDMNPLGGHTDGWIQVHPITRQTLAYLVGGKDFQILDLASPTLPVLLAEWTDAVPGRSGPTANLHSVFPHRGLIDNRHYTIIGPEYGGHPDGQPSGNIWVLDTTDPRQVKEVAAWTLPHEVDWDGTYMFSNHYLTAHNETVFVSMYHGGVWALDLGAVRPDNFTLLPAIGVFLPARETPAPPPNTFRWTPTLEEVLSFADGTLVTFDSMSGLYTFRFDEGNPAPPPPSWPVEPVTR